MSGHLGDLVEADAWQGMHVGAQPVWGRLELDLGEVHLGGQRLAGPPLAAVAGGVVDEDQAEVLGVPWPPAGYRGDPAAYGPFGVERLGVVVAAPAPMPQEHDQDHQAQQAGPGHRRNPRWYRHVNARGGTGAGAGGHGRVSAQTRAQARQARRVSWSLRSRRRLSSDQLCCTPARNWAISRIW